jgi:hypothetical protein
MQSLSSEREGDSFDVERFCRIEEKESFLSIRFFSIRDIQHQGFNRTIRGAPF